MIRHRSRLTARVTAVLALVELVTAGTPAAAEKSGKPLLDPAPPPAGAVPAGFADWAEVMAVQHKLNKAADAITAGDPAGYGGVIADPLTRELVVYWKGKPPAVVRETIARQRDAVPVRVLPSVYSQQELRAETDKLMRDKSITSAGPKPDGSGLDVSVAGTAADARRTAAVRDISVAYTIREHVRPTPVYDRWNDIPPWWGGAFYTGVGTGFGCTTGFSVTIGGYKELLTAAHCGYEGYAAVTAAGGFIGVTHGVNYGRDSMLIFPPEASESVIYTGGLAILGNPESARAVIGATGSFVGNFVCTSGAFSGERCNIRVTRPGIAINVGLQGIVYTINPVVEMEHVERAFAMGTGDSGGPVFAPLGSDSAYAMGTMTAIDTQTPAPCSGFGNNRQCAWRGYYVDVTGILAMYGGTIP